MIIDINDVQCHVNSKPRRCHDHAFLMPWNLIHEQRMCDIYKSKYRMCLLQLHKSTLNSSHKPHSTIVTVEFPVVCYAMSLVMAYANPDVQIKTSNQLPTTLIHIKTLSIFPSVKRHARPNSVDRLQTSQNSCRGLHPYVQSADDAHDPEHPQASGYGIRHLPHHAPLSIRIEPRPGRGPLQSHRLRFAADRENIE